MSRHIVTFTTPGGYYVYDREINSLLSTNETEYTAFQRIENNKDKPDDWKLLKKYTERGYLKESLLKEIEHPATQFMKFNLACNVAQITIQVTQNCLLRCKYCTYSGNYDNNRTHSNKSMSLDMMKKCIDFLMSRSKNVKELYVSFYGGEALIELDKIKECVQYIKESYKGRTVRYILTTNGTMFDDDSIKFLEDMNFDVSVSIDGPKVYHDLNRVFPDGTGSYDKIMTSLSYIKNNYPKFFEKISFLTTVAPGVDFACVDEFFSTNELLADSVVTQNTVNSYNAIDSVVYDDLYNIHYNFQNMKVMLSALGLYSKDKISKLFTAELAEIDRMYADLSEVIITEKTHPSGPCLPGIVRPFVSVDGSIFPCERVGEESEAVKIGHIDTGFDMDQINKVLNIGLLTEKECKTCWNFLHCGLCAVSCDGVTALSRQMRLEKCNSTKNDTLYLLKAICLLLENGYRFDNRM